ncbi:MAG: NAD(P)/FAD-dependent oxidoreductase [archaeon]
MENYDVIIVGAGPAGLFCSLELATKSKMKVLVIDKGHDAMHRKCPLTSVGRCLKCKPCNIMSGVGGAGGLSDGKLNLGYRIGGDLTEFVSPETAMEIIDYIDDVFLKSGANAELSGVKGTDELLAKCSRVGIRYIPIKQRHLGSDKLPVIITKIKNLIESSGRVKFLLNTEVVDVDNSKDFTVTVRNSKGEDTFRSKYMMVGAGRSGAEWLAEQANKLHIKSTYAPIDVGVRVEVANHVMDPVTKVNWDPKFHVYSDKYDDKVRTFCTCPSGFVTREDYGSYIGVNGHSMMDKKSDNTNFAFLTTVNLTEPVENTTDYGISIAKLATTIGGGKPILQRLRDLRRGKRSTWERLKKSYVSPTLKAVTPGDISMALPHRVVMNIIQGLEKLDKVVPGVAEDGTLLYAPEIKFYSMKFDVKNNMETNLPNLFVAGDGAGVSRGIVASAATGIIAARGIIGKGK